MDKEQQERLSENIFISQFNSVMDGIRESQMVYDRTIITISSALIGISVTALNFMFGKVHGNFCILTLSWGFFILSILGVLISFLISINSLEDASQNYFDTYILKKKGKPAKFYSLLSVLNILNGVFFFFGMVFFFLFGLDIYSSF